MIIKWKDSTEEDPIIYTSGRGRRGEYYMGKVSCGFCISMDIKKHEGGGTAFIGNALTLDRAKTEAQRFDNSNDKLTA